jgi:hypothetical protein
VPFCKPALLLISNSDSQSSTHHGKPVALCALLRIAQESSSV